MIRTVDFLGLPLITDDIHKIADWLVSLLDDIQPPVIISHVNANNYYHLYKNLTFCSRLKNNAHLLFEGIGMKLAASWLGLGWLPDINGTDLFPLVMTKLVNAKVPLYFLGADEFVVASAVQSLRSRWPEIQIAGYSSGYFNVTDEDKIVEAINASGAKLLLVGRGFILQETFSLRQRTRLSVSLIWNVGGLFDFISSNKPRAPLWIRRMRLEWLFRLGREPRRLWFRTFVVGPWLASHVLTELVKSHKPMRQKEV